MNKYATKCLHCPLFGGTIARDWYGVRFLTATPKTKWPQRCVNILGPGQHLTERH